MAGSITPDLTVVISRCAMAHGGCANRTRVNPSSANINVQLGNSRLGWRRPAIHIPGSGYGFRVRSLRARNEVDDPPHRHVDRIDCDPDVVAACGADGGDR